MNREHEVQRLCEADHHIAIGERAVTPTDGQTRIKSIRLYHPAP
jgi:hypothetical protein